MRSYLLEVKYLGYKDKDLVNYYYLGHNLSDARYMFSLRSLFFKDLSKVEVRLCSALRNNDCTKNDIFAEYMLEFYCAYCMTYDSNSLRYLKTF